MSYPFSNNPFDRYVPKLRDLQKEDRSYCAQLSKATFSEDKDKLGQSLELVRGQIKTLEQKIKLPSRSFDIYENTVNFLLEKFELDFPKPFDMSLCAHLNKRIVKMKYPDKSLHVRSQCLDCGRPLDKHKKIEFNNWTLLPEFDEDLYSERKIKIGRWFEKRNTAVNVNFPTDTQSHFGYQEFREAYRKKNPRPLSQSECVHATTKLTVRKYHNSQSAIVEQCRICGKHLKSLPRNCVKHMCRLVDFDEEIASKLLLKEREWNSQFESALENAKEDFSHKLTQKILSGEVSTSHQSPNDEYYTSLEWVNTRKRILVRDNYKCQACHENAECVHHIVYDNFGCENDLELISLCSNCHTQLHKIQDHSKYSFHLTPNEISAMLNVTLPDFIT